MLVVDGSGDAPFRLHEVELGDYAQTFARKRDRARVDLLGFAFVSWLGGRGQFGGAGIDALVLGGAFERIGAFAKDAFDPLVEEQARAVDELIDHSRRKVIGRRIAAGDARALRFGQGDREGAHTMKHGASMAV